MSGSVLERSEITFLTFEGCTGQMIRSSADATWRGTVVPDDVECYAALAVKCGREIVL